MTRNDGVGLAGFMVAVALVAALGGWATAAGQPDWYGTLSKPPGTPPDWLFGPVWTTLYALMAVAAWRVWRRPGRGGRALMVFWGQLALNLAWSVLFFALKLPLVALIDLGILLALILWMVGLFRARDRVAAWLVAPYPLWVAYAGYLNAGIVVMN